MILAAVTRFARTYFRYRTTLAALTDLDDRGLRDIGLNRSQIVRTAWQSAQG